MAWEREYEIQSGDRVELIPENILLRPMHAG